MTEVKQQRKFNKELLDECMKRDGATLIGEYTKITREIIINFKCSCGEEYKKVMRGIVKAGALCNKCGKQHMVEALKNTMLKKYGTTNPMKNEGIKKKAIETINNRTKEGQDDINKKRKITNQEKYGGDAPSCSLEVKKKAIQTNIEKYGTIHPNQNEEMKEKVAKSNIAKYGVKSTAQLKEVKEKAKDTCLKRYGVISTALVPEIMEKQKTTLKKNFGVEYFSQSPIIQEKIKKTNIERYGVEHPNQNPLILEKAQSKRWKDYKMPSGVIRKVQGYEPFALTTLVKTYTEDQIKTDRKDVPRIEYEVDSKKKYYFPDIFLPHENKLIEVKSTWTYKCETDNIQAKAEACRAQGYTYDIWCFDAKGNRVDPTSVSAIPPDTP